MLSEYETDVVKTSPRHTLVRLVKYTTRQDLYEVASEELYQRDTQRLAKEWFQILTGQSV